MIRLPIDGLIPEILGTLGRVRHAVIVSPPGSGKTTRVPPALTADGRVILLQPRRVAARSLARRIATEQGWQLGGRVGWQIRFDRNFTRETELLVCTEGILTARLQSDPLLSEFRTVVLDEFHERSIHADLALALLAAAAEARDDLRIVVMSATIDPAPIVRFLGGTDVCAVIESAGALHPVKIDHAPHLTVAAAVKRALSETSGDVLVFLPGRREIDDTRTELSAVEAEIVPLHGSLSPQEQDRAVMPSANRRVILATNIAETSLTVEGVESVVDSGLHKIIRYDAETGIDQLVTERIPRDAADQRAGRAGRVRPGLAIRLWDGRDILEPQREPEIDRIDLAPVILDVLRWGEDPRLFAWFDAPAADGLDAALDLLKLMRAVEEQDGRPRLTLRGETMQKLPLPPRIGAILVAAQGSRIARRACAALAEGQLLVDARMASDSDLLHLEDRGRDRRLDRVADEMKRILEQSGMPLADEGSEAEFLQAVLSGFPDRVARRRAPGSDRYLLASGQGAMLSPRSSVREAEWLVAVEVRSGGAVREAWIEVASRIEPEWLTVDREEIVHALDPGGAKVRATKTRWYGSIALEEHPVRPDPRAAAPLLREAFVQRGPGLANEAVMRRARFAGVEIDLESVARDAITGATMPELHLLDWIPWEARQRIEREAPTHLEVPSGRRIPLEYGEGGTVTLRVKLQEMFGLASTPRIGRERTPVTIELLAPNGRPVQVTRDLESFWNTTYAEVRKELRGRYPKHPWPDDPWNAEATARTKRREKE